jgi:hypothetical protein
MSFSGYLIPMKRSKAAGEATVFAGASSLPVLQTLGMGVIAIGVSDFQTHKPFHKEKIQ